MKKLALKLHAALLAFAAWGWPLLLLDFATGAYKSPAPWANWINSAAFLYVLSVPAWPVTLVLDKSRRERAMSRLVGAREDDERERAVTGDAARSALLLSLALQSVLLVMSLTSVRLVWNPESKETKKGTLSAGLSFSTERHLNPFGSPLDEKDPAPRGVSAGGYLLSPACFPVLALLILLQLAAFRGYAGRRYEGVEA